MSQSTNIVLSQPTKDYAAGSMQKGTRRVGEFLAPTVLVPASVGRYKKWSDKSRYRIPATLLAFGGGAAAQLAVDAVDVEFAAKPNGLDYFIDRSIASVASGEVDLLVKDGSDLLADVYGLCHLYETVNLAKGAAGAGTDVDSSDVAIDLVEVIDPLVEQVMLEGKCEEVGVLFGARAWRKFKNHAKTKARVCGTPLRWELNPTLFTADAEYMGCFAGYDTTPEGVAPVLDFLLKDEILIFGRHAIPNRRDPSFMKTLRFDKSVENIKVVPTTDGRRLRVTITWSAEIKVTNSAAVKRINYLP